MTRAAAQRGFLLLLALGAAALLPEALSYQGGSQYFPVALLSALLALCLVALVRNRPPPDAAAPFFGHAGRFALGLGMMVAYTLAMPELGYFTSSVLFIPAMAWLLGLRDWRLIALTVAGYLAFVWLIFQWLFQRDMAREFFMPWLLGY